MFFTIPSAIPVVKAYNSASAGLKLTDCCVLDHAERDTHLHCVTPPLVLLHVWCCPAQSLSGYTLMNCGNVLISTKHFLCNRDTFQVSSDALHVHLVAFSGTEDLFCCLLNAVHDSCETIRGSWQTNRDQGRSQPEMFAPTPPTVSLKTMLAASSNDRNNHPERDYITIASGVHTAFLHPDIDQALFPEPPEESTLCEDEACKLHKALYGDRKAPKPWHQHVVSLLERLSSHPLLTDPSCFRNDELASIENLRFLELCSKSSHDAHCVDERSDWLIKFFFLAE